MGGRSGGKLLPAKKRPMEPPDPWKGQGRQCTARSSQTGKPCGNAPIRGGTVCRKHGGAAPQVKAKAALRLATLTDPAIRALDALLKPAAAKKHPAQALGAAKDVLDRTGHKTPDELDISSSTATIDLATIDGMSTKEIENARDLYLKLLGRSR